jgi:hypothetical protein
MQATPEELLEVIKRLFPREYERAQAELVIIKQQARIAELEAQAASGEPSTDNCCGEPQQASENV